METRELTIDELASVSGGDFVMGSVGSLNYFASPELSTISWTDPSGKGTWSMVSGVNGVHWTPT